MAKAFGSTAVQRIRLTYVGVMAKFFDSLVKPSILHAASAMNPRSQDLFLTLSL